MPHLRTTIIPQMKRLAIFAIALCSMLVLANCGAPPTLPSPPPSTAPTPTLTQTYTVATSVTPPDGGYISPSGGQYTAGTQVTLTAVPASGYTFNYWEGCASGSSPTIHIIMNSNKSVTAHFESITSPPTPPPLPAVIQEVPQYTGLISSNYAWVYGGKEWTWELQIPQALYDYYREIPRPPTQNYSVYVTHPLDDTYIDYLVDEIRKAARQEGFDELETVEFAANFVQSLPYTPDSVTVPYDEYPRYPIETLVDNGGDCEDTSILMASLLNRMGYGVVLIIFPGSHCAAGVLGGEGIYGTYWEHNGRKYFYLETTNIGWGIGDIPKEYKGATAHIFDMAPVSILTHDWSATGRGSTVELEVTVQNLGSAPADSIYILAGFDAGGGMLWNPEQSHLFQVLVNHQVTVKFSLQAPLDKHTRLVIQIVEDDYAVDESYSEWFDT